MRVVKSPKKMSEVSAKLKRKGKTIGFVPTMGYLHEGHLSLIRKARRENDVVVVSIFVNPIQFGPKEDYKRYPRDLKRDLKLADAERTDIIFYPDVRQMYPHGYASSVNVRDLTSVMCGLSRPSHFEGVTTVCMKLFNIVRPDIAYFGQKDYQQAIVIKRMVEDLNMGFKIKILPIIREKSGLAVSSRNEYLTPEQRKDATVLYKSLKEAKGLIRSGEKNAAKIKIIMRRMISKKDVIGIDYITIADPKTLKEHKKITSRVLVALAVRAGKTRLIDNVLVNV